MSKTNSNNESKSKAKTAKSAEGMTLLDHLEELRKRCTWMFIALILAFIACYPFAERLMAILIEPMVLILNGGNFQFTHPAEAFFAHVKISFLGAIFLASPFIFWQFWAFIAPGLYTHERRMLVPLAFFSAFFFLLGAFFCFYVVFPFGFAFFASFSSTKMLFIPKISEYISFSLKLIFAFGFIFELPLVIFFLARLGLVSSNALRAKRKYAILIAFVVAAVLTPPDPFTQTLMAIPLILLYELSIWITYFLGTKENRPEKDTKDKDNKKKNKKENKNIKNTKKKANSAETISTNKTKTNSIKKDAAKADPTSDTMAKETNSVETNLTNTPTESDTTKKTSTVKKVSATKKADATKTSTVVKKEKTDIVKASTKKIVSKKNPSSKK